MNHECPNCQAPLTHTHTKDITDYVAVNELRHYEDDSEWVTVDKKFTFTFFYFACPTCKRKWYWGDTSYYDGLIEERS